MDIAKKGVIFIIFIVAIFSGCDNTFHPFVEGRVPYSVYGYLEAGRDTNFVRVTELDNPLLAGSTRELHIKKVTLTNLKTGAQQILQDSVVRFDSVYTHNFYTTLNIVPGTTYKLKVEGSDGELTTSTTVPSVVNPTTYTNHKRYPYIEQSARNNIFTSCPLNVRVVFKPVDPRSTFRTFHPGNDLYCNRSVYNEQQLKRRVMDVCVKNPDGRITVGVHHYSTDTFKPVRPTESLKVPGGAGFFGSFYTKTFKINYSADQPDSIFNFLPPCPAPASSYCIGLNYGNVDLCPPPFTF